MTLGATALIVTLVTIAAFVGLGLLQASRQPTTLEDYMVSRNRIGTGPALATIVASAMRSEERRVGKECRSRWSPDH